MRGRKPIPTEIKKARGNPGKRPLNDREPKPPRGRPPCPEFLDAVGRAEWDRVTALLARSNVLAEMDGAVLAAYCQAFSRWDFAERQLQTYGAVVLSPDKKFPMPSPYLAIANKAMEQMHKFAVEYGLTPSSRSRVTTLPPWAQEENPKERFFRREEQHGIE